MSAPTRARIGVIGAGWWVTENHLPILETRDDVELVAVCRRSEAAVSMLKERFGFQIAVTDYADLFDPTVGQLDGVIVGSPHHLHYEHTKAALERGCHVMVEKPMATRWEDAQELFDLARKYSLEILIPHGWNFKPYTREARRLVLGGDIGEIEHVACQMASPRRAQYSGEAEILGSLVAQEASTYSDPEQGVGYGWGQLVHALGMLFHITELQAKEVVSMMGLSRTGADLHDSITINFDNGSIGSISGSAGLPTHLGYQLDLCIFGSEGVLLMDLERERLEIHRNDEEDTVYPMEYGSGEYECAAPVEMFADLCTGKDIQNDGSSSTGLRCVEVLDAAYRSTRNGRAEPVNSGR